MISWQQTTLGEILSSGGSIKTGPFGTMLKASEYTQSGVPVISVGEVRYGSFQLRTDTPRVSVKTTDRLSEYLLESGDIVFGRKGAVDRSAQVKAAEHGWFLGSDGIRIRLPDTVSSAFIAYQFQLGAIKRWLLQHASGSTMLSLNQKILARLPLSLPPISTQRAIAEVLGALDDKITANNELATAADDLARALFRQALKSATYSDESFADLAEVSGGGTPSTKKPEYWDGTIPWATPTDVTSLSGPYLEETSRTISEMGLKYCSSALYPAGSILMTSRATIGAFALAQVPTAVNQGFIVVQPNDPSLRFWLFHEMRSRVDEFISLANGATFLELSRGNFKKFKVRKATPETMAAFNETAETLHDSARAALLENNSLAATRDALLPQLMSGKIRVREAESIVEDVL